MDHRDKLIRSGLELASELELETVLQRIGELAVELTDATYGALGVLESDGSIAEFVTTGITPSSGRRSATFREVAASWVC